MNGDWWPDWWYPHVTCFKQVLPGCCWIATSACWNAIQGGLGQSWMHNNQQMDQCFLQPSKLILIYARVRFFLNTWWWIMLPNPVEDPERFTDKDDTTAPILQFSGNAVFPQFRVWSSQVMGTWPRNMGTTGQRRVVPVVTIHLNQRIQLLAEVYRLLTDIILYVHVGMCELQGWVIKRADGPVAAVWWQTVQFGTLSEATFSWAWEHLFFIDLYHLNPRVDMTIPFAWYGHAGRSWGNPHAVAIARQRMMVTPPIASSPCRPGAWQEMNPRSTMLLYILYCIILYYILSYYITSHYITLYCILLLFTIFYSIVLY